MLTLLTFTANQWTGFFMIMASVMKELKMIYHTLSAHDVKGKVKTRFLLS